MFYHKLSLVFGAFLLTVVAGAEDLQESVVHSETPSQELSVPVTFREKAAFQIFYKNEQDHVSAVEKAGVASSNLEKALSSSAPLETDAPMTDVLSKSGGKIEIRVRGYKIVDLEAGDLPSTDENMAEYGARLKEDLSVFVDQEMSRLKIQRIALQLFLSIFFAVIGFVVFRQIHQAFANAESILEQKRESFRPVVVLSETLISGQALGGLFALSLAVGRMLAYIVIILTTIAAILGQFATSRTIMAEFFSQFLSQMMRGFQSLLESIPGLLLAVLLIFCFQLALNVLDLFLKGAKSGRISIGFLSWSRVPIIRFWGIAFLTILFIPLILASVFGRFNTPLEMVILMGAGVFILSGFPVLLNVAAGSFVLWQGHIKPGQWIEVGGKSGEVSNMSLHKLTIVPESGGRIYIPMVLLLFQNCFEKKEAPQAEFRVHVKRKHGLKETVRILRDLFPSDDGLNISCLSLSASEYVFVFHAPQFERDIRSEILTTLSAAHESGQIELTDELIKEVVH